MAAPSKHGPSAFILASLIETELTLPLREDFTLLPLAQEPASGRYERPSGRKRPRQFWVGFTQALGGRAGPKLERVEFPAFTGGVGGPQTRTRQVSRVQVGPRASSGAPGAPPGLVGFLHEGGAPLVWAWIPHLQMPISSLIPHRGPGAGSGEATS